MDAASRYAVEQVLTALDPRTHSVAYAVFRGPPIASSVSLFTRYQWRQGDRWDFLAAEHLGDPNQWWAILDANPTIQDPLAVEPGTIIHIPNRTPVPPNWNDD